MAELPISARTPDPPLSILVSLATVLWAARSAGEAVFDLIGPVWSRLGYSGGSLWLLNPGTGGLLRLVRWQTDPNTDPASADDRIFLLQKGQGLVGWAFERSRVEWMGRYAVSNGESRPEGRACVPLPGAGIVLGVLEFVSEDAGEPTADRLAFLEHLGRQFADFLNRLGA
jgi:GAF domain-containing protein